MRRVSTSDSSSEEERPFEEAPLPDDDEPMHDAEADMGVNEEDDEERQPEAQGEEEVRGPEAMEDLNAGFLHAPEVEGPLHVGEIEGRDPEVHDREDNGDSDDDWEDMASNEGSSGTSSSTTSGDENPPPIRRPESPIQPIEDIQQEQLNPDPIAPMAAVQNVEAPPPRQVQLNPEDPAPIQQMEEADRQPERQNQEDNQQREDVRNIEGPTPRQVDHDPEYPPPIQRMQAIVPEMLNPTPRQPELDPEDPPANQAVRNLSGQLERQGDVHNHRGPATSTPARGKKIVSFLL